MFLLVPEMQDRERVCSVCVCVCVCVCVWEREKTPVCIHALGLQIHPFDFHFECELHSLKSVVTTKVKTPLKQS